MQFPLLGAGRLILKRATITSLLAKVTASAVQQSQQLIYTEQHYSKSP
jgi:hypothetical protein